MSNILAGTSHLLSCPPSARTTLDHDPSTTSRRYAKQSCLLEPHGTGFEHAYCVYVTGRRDGEDAGASTPSPTWQIATGASAYLTLTIATPTNLASRILGLVFASVGCAPGARASTWLMLACARQTEGAH